MSEAIKTKLVEAFKVDGMITKVNHIPDTNNYRVTMQNTSQIEVSSQFLYLVQKDKNVEVFDTTNRKNVLIKTLKDADLYAKPAKTEEKTERGEPAKKKRTTVKEAEPDIE